MQQWWNVCGGVGAGAHVWSMYIYILYNIHTHAHTQRALEAAMQEFKNAAMEPKEKWKASNL